MRTALVPSVASGRPGLRRHLLDLYSRRETVRYLVSTQLKAGHRDKVLGHLWSLLDPLLFMLVYYFVFGVLFGQTERGRAGEFMSYIFVGLVAWGFFSTSVTQAVNCIRGNRGLIHEIAFPKSVFPLAVCLSRLYDFLWGLAVLLAVLLIAGTPPTFHLLWLPLLIAAQLLLTLGVSFVAAYLGALFADTGNVVQPSMRLLFFLTPIFYYVRGEKSLVGDDIRFYYMLNPVSCLYECYRDVLLYGRMPETGYLLYALAFSLFCCLVGFKIFTSAEGKFTKYV